MTANQLLKNRTQLGISQTALANAVKMSRFNVSQSELGYRKLSKAESQRLEKFFAKKKGN